MDLPPLTKKNNRRESKIDSLVLDWFKDNWPRSCAVEVKVKGGKVLEHQLLALKVVADGAFSFKIPDSGRKNPFDGFVLKNADAFLVICDGHACVVKNIDTGDIFDIKL